jgi:hypothetical protein
MLPSLDVPHEISEDCSNTWAVAQPWGENNAAQFIAIGALSNAVLMHFDWDKKAYQKIPVAEQVEVAASLIGRARIATWTRDARLAARSCCRERVRSHCLAGAGGFDPSARQNQIPAVPV